MASVVSISFLRSAVCLCIGALTRRDLWHAQRWRRQQQDGGGSRVLVAFLQPPSRAARGASRLWEVKGISQRWLQVASAMGNELASRLLTTACRCIAPSTQFFLFVWLKDVCFVRVI